MGSSSKKGGKSSSGNKSVKRVNTFSGPLTSKTHKLRDSWRNSFSRFSQNSLAQLDESSTSKGSLKGRFRFPKSKKDPLDASSGSQSSQFSIGGDAPCF